MIVSLNGCGKKTSSLSIELERQDISRGILEVCLKGRGGASIPRNFQRGPRITELKI